MDSDPSIIRKPKNWCGTEPSFNYNEANQVPLGDNMSAATEGKRKYPCVTQDGFAPTYSDPSNVDGGGSAPDDPSGIMVGIGRIVPRWTANKANPTKLLYFVVRDGFKSDEDFNYASSSFQSAAEEWNALSLGFTFSPVHDQTQAHFLVKYFKPVRDEGVLASAFFPNQVMDVRIYDKTLIEPFWRNILHNTLLHEIGHIVGLRHEFAMKIDPETGRTRESAAEQIGDDNPHSVMSYDDVNVIDEQDKKDTAEFYSRENGSLVGNVPIRDFIPVPLT